MLFSCSKPNSKPNAVCHPPVLRSGPNVVTSLANGEDNIHYAKLEASKLGDVTVGLHLGVPHLQVSNNINSNTTITTIAQVALRIAVGFDFLQ